jgi:hypothetical protein
VREREGEREKQERGNLLLAADTDEEEGLRDALEKRERLREFSLKRRAISPLKTIDLTLQ